MEEKYQQFIRALDKASAFRIQQAERQKAEMNHHCGFDFESPTQPWAECKCGQIRTNLLLDPIKGEQE